MAIAIHIHQRDTRANQPAANTVTIGTLYYVTDEEVLEYSNGAAWLPYSPTSVDPSAHASSHEVGGDDVVDVKALGGYPEDSPPTEFLRADREFAAVDVTGLVGFPNGSPPTEFLREDGSFAPVDVSTLVGFPNGSPPTRFLREDGVFEEPEGTGAPPTQTKTIGISIGNGVDEITTGVKGYIRVPVAVTLTGWTLLSQDGGTGAIVVDVWLDTYANFPPTDADSITNGNEPEIPATGGKAEDSDLSDWTDVTIPAGSVLGFNVDSVTDLTKVLLLMTATVD